jgi:hypothetical protein
LLSRRVTSVGALIEWSAHTVGVRLTGAHLAALRAEEVCGDCMRELSNELRTVTGGHFLQVVRCVFACDRKRV